mgnify:CR=1 FL=1
MLSIRKIKEVKRQYLLTSGFLQLCFVAVLTVLSTLPAKAQTTEACEEKRSGSVYFKIGNTGHGLWMPKFNGTSETYHFMFQNDAVFEMRTNGTLVI